MTDGYLMDADCVHGFTWFDCDLCAEPPSRYVSRPQVVEAVRWTGHVKSASKCIEQCGADKVRLTEGYDLELLAGKDGAQEWVPVPVGHWLVHQPGDLSDIWPVAPDYFTAKYQPDEDLTVKWAVTVVVPIDVEEKDELLTAVADAAYGWEPEDRDGWDIEVFGGPHNDR